MADRSNLSEALQVVLVGVLKARFEKNAHRHKGLAWADVEAKLETNPGKLWSLNEMESTGGEPDVVVVDKNSDILIRKHQAG